MRYCGVVAAGPYLQLATLEEVRTEDPPVRLHARLFEPGSPEQVTTELRGESQAVIGIGSPLGGPGRAADQDLLSRGVAAPPPRPSFPAACPLSRRTRAPSPWSRPSACRSTRAALRTSSRRAPTP